MPHPEYTPKQPIGAVQTRLLKELATAASDAPARREYLMTPEEFESLKEACNPRIALGDAKLIREHTQRRAQAFWEKLGEKYGFDWTTTAPVQGKHHGFFTAVPLPVTASTGQQ